MFVSSIVPYRDHIPVRKQTTAVDMLEEYLAGGNVDGYLADLKRVGFSGFSCSDMQAVIFLTCLAYLGSDKLFYYELIMQMAPFYCGRLHEERYNTAFPIFSRNFFDAMERNTCMARDCLVLRAKEFLAARHDRVCASYDHFAKQDFERVLGLLLPPADCKRSAFAETVAKSLAEWREAYNPEITTILLLLDGFSQCLQINKKALCKLYVLHESSDYYKTAITVEVEGFHGTLAQAKEGQNVDDVVDYVASLFFQGLAGRNFCNLRDEFHDGLVLLLTFCYQNTKDSKYLELLYFVIPYIIAYERDEAIEHLKVLPNLELAAESIRQWIAAYNPVPLEIVEIVRDFSAHFSISSCDLLCEVAKTTCGPNKVLKALLAFRRVRVEDLDEQEKRVVVALCQNPQSDNKVLGKCQKMAGEIDITVAARTVACNLPAAVDELLDRIEALLELGLVQNALVSFAENVMAAGLCQEATDLLAKRPTLVLQLFCAGVKIRSHSSLTVCAQAVRSDYFPEAIRNELVSGFKEKGFMSYAFLFQKRELSYDELSVQFSELGIKKSTPRKGKKDVLPLSRTALYNTQRSTMEQKAVEIVKNVFGGTYFAHERLAPGCSGSVIMRVTGNKQDVVVRFWNMQWKEFFAQDLDCHKVASAAGYGPKLFFDDKERGITVMQYVKPLSPYCKKGQLKALSELLIKIHKGPKVPSGIDRRLYLDTLLDEASANPYGIDVEALRVIKNDVFDCTRRGATVVACHRDLHPGNLLFSDKGYVAIDYTWGAMDDLFADLANIAIFHCSTPDEEMLLLQNYFGRMPSEQECARLALMKLPAKMFYGLEFLSLSGPSPLTPPQAFACYQNFGKHGQITEKADFLAYSLTLLNEVREFASHKEYKQALNLL